MYQTFKEKLMPILIKLFSKIKMDGMLSSKSFYEAGITLILKSGKKPNDNKNRKIGQSFMNTTAV